MSRYRQWHHPWANLQLISQQVKQS